MAKKNASSNEPTLGPMDRVRKGQDAVNEAVSFVDWIRSIIDWVKGLFGR